MDFKTQMQAAKENIITKEMEFVANEEGMEINELVKGVAEGKTVIPANKNHKIKNQNFTPKGIGKGLKTKVNANIGTSKNSPSMEKELEKLKLCLKYGADAVMDLSTAGNINELREKMIAECNLPFGTVCTYQAVKDNNGDIKSLKEEDFINAFELHAKQGVDFITVHAGLLKRMVPLARERHTGIVSRGGAIIAEWMHANGKENPYYSNFDKILEIAKEHDVTLSLGDGLRPGSLKDATDQAQIEELKVLGKLTKKAWEKGIQVMIEGPGHIPLNEIQINVELQKNYCHGAPFYVLGPLVTDIGAGYDHITSAIGGALAGAFGADFLCYVTPSEHLSLPNKEEVREGIIASRIAGHAADIAKQLPNARKVDDEMSEARSSFNWEKQFELALDSEKAREIKCRDTPNEGKEFTNFCSMCGPEFCPMKIFKGKKE